ncbi:hypothetical protein DMENIID0001_064180 [Sergentomyia squamirostris]
MKPHDDSLENSRILGTVREREKSLDENDFWVDEGSARGVETFRCDFAGRLFALRGFPWDISHMLGHRLECWGALCSTHDS